MKIAQLGQPVLWQAAAPVPVAEIATPEFQKFLEDMQATMRDKGGVGLAAPQVYASRRVFLAAILPPVTEEEPPGVEVFVNPRLSELSAEMSSAWEGCLSFPELLVYVPRHERVRIDYFGADGQPRALELSGFPARVVQHEYDHIEGTLTLDRAASPRHIIKASEAKEVLQGED